jgi:hypothetical protein
MKLFYLLLAAVFVIGVHVGISFSKPIIKYKMFKSDAEDVMRFGLKNELDLKEKILKVMKDRGIPYKQDEFMDLEDIEEVQVWLDDDDRLVAEVNYSETVDYFGIYKKTFKYKLELRQ